MKELTVKTFTCSVMAFAMFSISAGAARAEPPGSAPAARCLVWAKPGETGDALDAANWTEYASSADYEAGKPGKPATAGPDANTDLVLPGAPEGGSYIAGFRKIGAKGSNPWTAPPSLLCRNVTIGHGAALDGGYGSTRGVMSYSSRSDFDCAAEIHGSVNVAEGGCIYGKLIFAGGASAQFRVPDSPEPLGNNITVRKSVAASVTIQAPRYDLTGAVTVESGRLVLGPDTHLRFDATDQARARLGKLPAVRQGEGAADRRDCCVLVCKGATLELQGGSSLARIKAPENPAADLRIEGTLQVSSPGGAGAPVTLALCMAKGEGKFLTQPGGLYLRPTGEIKNTGRLVITAASPPGPAKADTGVSVFLEKPADFGDVTFDYLRAGGIVSRDPAAAKAALAKAAFGEHCAARGDGLFAKLDLIDFSGGMGAVEFVDGLKSECEILYPLAGRLIVRSKGYRIAQSFDLKSVHSVTIAGKTTEFNPSRPLTPAESELRKLNALWADAPGPGQVGKFANCVWPKAPLLVWRNPGVSGSRFVGPNWLDENGVPYFESPMDIDPDIDILLPGSATYYTATGFGTGGIGGKPVPCRHLTVELNAQYGATFDIRGNMWLKHGSDTRGRNFGQYRNPAVGIHRFVRADGMTPSMGKKATSPFRERRDGSLGQWADFEIGKDSTIEFTGRARVAADWVSFKGGGTFILSEGSFLCGGERAAITIAPDTSLVMLQDAMLGHEITVQRDECFASIFVGGTLMIGLPDRPITRDMPFPLAGVLKDKINRSASSNSRTTGASLIVSNQGRLAVYSADPAKARVVFSMWNTERARNEGAKWGKPDGIILDFAGKAELNGVVFDNCYEGGIMVSPEQRATWKNVFYGEHNLAVPDKLYWRLIR
jgi:hypothetical protein